jgi:hypothetical protein
MNAVIPRRPKLNPDVTELFGYVHALERLRYDAPTFKNPMPAASWPCMTVNRVGWPEQCYLFLDPTSKEERHLRKLFIACVDGRVLELDKHGRPLLIPGSNPPEYAQLSEEDYRAADWTCR